MVVVWSVSQAMKAWRSASCGTRITRASAPKRPFTYSRAYQHANTSPRPKTRSIAELLESGSAAENVHVDGWVRSVRKQKRIAFAAVGDGSTVDSVQAVLKPEDAAKYEGFPSKPAMCANAIVVFHTELLSACLGNGYHPKEESRPSSFKQNAS